MSLGGWSCCCEEGICEEGLGARSETREHGMKLWDWNGRFILDTGLYGRLRVLVLDFPCS